VLGEAIQIALVDDDARVAAAVRGAFRAIVGSHAMSVRELTQRD
jgi:hypothetical protein